MLRDEFRQSDIDWDPEELLAEHKALSGEDRYWADVACDLDEHPDVWPLMDYEAFK